MSDAKPSWAHAWSGERRAPLTEAQQRPFDLGDAPAYEAARVEREATRRRKREAALGPGPAVNVYDDWDKRLFEPWSDRKRRLAAEVRA